MKKLIIKDITHSTKSDDPFKGIKISAEKELELVLKSLGENFSKKLPILGDFLDIVQRCNDKVDSIRLAILLSELKERIGSLEDYDKHLSLFLSSGNGYVLFSKILRIVNRGNFDRKYIGLLAKVLKNMNASVVEKMFDEYDYVLSQIERLTPQSLVLLSNFKNWKNVSLNGGTTISGQTLVHDWEKQATDFFGGSIGIIDFSFKQRMRHAFKELESSGIIFLDQNVKISLTDVGSSVHYFITT